MMGRNYISVNIVDEKREYKGYVNMYWLFFALDMKKYIWAFEKCLEINQMNLISLLNFESKVNYINKAQIRIVKILNLRANFD